MSAEDQTSVATRPDAGTGQAAAPVDATDPGLLAWLEGATAAELDGLPFGVVAMAPDSTVQHYNLAESRLAGLAPGRVVGRPFFSGVAPCMNNPLVAERFAAETNLDALIDYVLTLRMSWQKVRLRLLKAASARRMYLVVERRA